LFLLTASPLGMSSASAQSLASSSVVVTGNDGNLLRLSAAGANFGANSEPGKSSVPVAFATMWSIRGEPSKGSAGRTSSAAVMSSSLGSVYVFMVRLMDECRMAAWAVCGATPPLLKNVANVCRMA
jgi:hypothetical protein